MNFLSWLVVGGVIGSAVRDCARHFFDDGFVRGLVVMSESGYSAHLNVTIAQRLLIPISSLL